MTPYRPLKTRPSLARKEVLSLIDGFVSLEYSVRLDHHWLLTLVQQLVLSRIHFPRWKGLKTRGNWKSFLFFQIQSSNEFKPSNESKRITATWSMNLRARLQLWWTYSLAERMKRKRAMKTPQMNDRGWNKWRFKSCVEGQASPGEPGLTKHTTGPRCLEGCYPSRCPHPLGLRCDHLRALAHPHDPNHQETLRLLGTGQNWKKAPLM